MESVRKCSRTTAAFCRIHNSEEYTTTSSVVPIVVGLKSLVRHVRKAWDSYHIKKLSDELKMHFDKYVNPSTAAVDMYYLVAGCLKKNTSDAWVHAEFYTTST